MSSRPEFMITLGLGPPYTVEDVKQAYLIKAKTAHPDVGGDATSFRKLQDAYERGMEFAQFHESRRRWIRTRMERYILQEELATKLRDHGGQIDVEATGWVRESFDGDFAQLAEVIVEIRLRGPRIDDSVLSHLAEHRNVLGALLRLDLAESNVTDDGLECLRGLTSLEEMNLAGTRVTNVGLKTLQRMHGLSKVDLRGTATSWWGRCQLRWRHSHLTLVSGRL